MVKVRFAPSPTGYLHILVVPALLFLTGCMLVLRRLKFVLRIEDTDLAEIWRVAYVDEILDSMKWLGLDWDELYFQSKRFEIYKKYAQNTS